MMMDVMEKMGKEEGKENPKMELAMSKVEELKNIAQSMGMDLMDLIQKCEESEEGEESPEMEASEEEDKRSPAEKPEVRAIIARLAIKKSKGE